MTKKNYPELDYNIMKGVDLIDADLPGFKISIEDILVGLSTGTMPISFVRNIILNKIYTLIINSPRIICAFNQNEMLKDESEKVRMTAAEYILKAYEEFDEMYKEQDIKNPTLRMITAWEEWIKQHPGESMQLFPAWESVKHYIDINGVDNNVPEDIIPIIYHEFYFKTFEDAYNIVHGKNPKNYKELFTTNQNEFPRATQETKNKQLSKNDALSQGKSYSLPTGEIDDISFSSISDICKMPGDIMSSLSLPMDVSSILGDSYTNDLPESSLFQSAGSSAGIGFTLGSGITIPLEYNINVSGLEEFGALNQVIDESSTSIEQTDDLAKNATSSIMGQYQNLTEEQVSLNASIAALNFSGITMPFLNISSSVEDADKNVVTFSDRLSNIAGIAGQIGGAFMSVDEEIGKTIMSAGTLTEGVAGIFKAFEGDKVNGLGLMSGIQGGFAGLQGLFGGEAGSDSSQLLGGLGGVGAGIAGLLTDEPWLFSPSEAAVQ